LRDAIFALAGFNGQELGWLNKKELLAVAKNQPRQVLLSLEAVLPK
jgi:hypothetical protein